MLKIFKILIPKSQREKIRQTTWEIQNSNNPKIFGIGNNKTGTTSLRQALFELGYKVGKQRQAELLHQEWAKRNFQPIVEYCKTAEFFQDVPFSKPFTFIALDQAYVNSKFILTIRDDPEQWYNSITKFHGKKWGMNGKIPTQEDLKQASYISKGRPWEMNRLTYTTPADDPYQKDILIQSYIDHNNSVIEYFRHRPDDLLVLNVAKKGAYKKLCEFLGKPVTQEEFPWKNKT
jgi:hypothetical protein